MRFGITVMLTDTSISPVELAREVEARGFDGLYLPEHTHIPSARTTPAPMGEPLPPQYWHCLDPFVALAQAAAVTERIRLGTGIALIAQRDAILTAKEVATLDHLSGGRVVLGVGFGWNAEEAADHGVDWERRREVVREKVEAMKALWTADEAAYDGDHVRFAPSWQWPKPAQHPHPPVLIGGGGGPKLFRHVAAWADGWMPIGGRGIRASLPALREAFEKVGRHPDTARVVPFGSLPDPGKFDHFASMGIEEVVLGFDPAPRDETLAILDRYAAVVEDWRDGR